MTPEPFRFRASDKRSSLVWTLRCEQFAGGDGSGYTSNSPFRWPGTALLFYGPAIPDARSEIVPDFWMALLASEPPVSSQPRNESRFVDNCPGHIRGASIVFVRATNKIAMGCMAHAVCHPAPAPPRPPLEPRVLCLRNNREQLARETNGCSHEEVVAVNRFFVTVFEHASRVCAS